MKSNKENYLTIGTKKIEWDKVKWWQKAIYYFFLALSLILAIVFAPLLLILYLFFGERIKQKITNKCELFDYTKDRLEIKIFNKVIYWKEETTTIFFRHDVKVKESKKSILKILTKEFKEEE